MEDEYRLVDEAKRNCYGLGEDPPKVYDGEYALVDKMNDAKKRGYLGEL